MVGSKQTLFSPGCLFLQASLPHVIETSRSTCETITTSFCKDLPYTETLLPGILGHKTQEEAKLALEVFSPLVHYGCSPHLKQFLCSVYFPKCMSGKAVTPCRTLCEQARTDCGPLLNSVGLVWPENLKCEAFTTDSCEQVRMVFFMQVISLIVSVLRFV